MQVRSSLILLLLLCFALASCAQQEQTLPTIAPEITEVTEEAATELPTATPFNPQRATLPPTWTPSPAAGELGGQATPTPEIQAPEQQAAQQGATPLEVCVTFGEDRTLNSRTFTPGGPVQVFWTPVTGASSYSVSLIDDTGEVLKTGYTAQTTLVFEPELFEPNRIYGWEAYPIDPAGRQMCISRGAELIPDNLPGF